MQHLLVAAAAGSRRAAERAERRARVAEIDAALGELGRRRRAGRVSEEEFMAERQQLLKPVMLCPVLA
ncbi:hypothetical protein [Subtercola boreus]|uniref:Uncharacterized protein n=1 Tax=Subtercola boreus TaxID=120213 RepID=A0A3E0WC18_9MICO|nr:hypothetical protein [Subtercola boreus]RFA20775.1 hypothetical protein B7R24_08370 [Subtercola boreus]RFA20890.1 hypothetical protein B7R23_08310 [Subtercola boreus]RFA27083.1 hypothetical protein B7R25_08435 [Subtercola boreus]